MKLVLKLIFVYSLFAIIGCPNRSNDKSTCINEDNLAKENTCFAATVLIQGNPFPNPIQTGSTLKLKMKIGAVNNNFSPISCSISTKVFSSTNGQLVMQQNIGSVPNSTNFQDIPIWSNINVAAGTYFLEITINAGDCGSKKICLADKRIVVVKK
jgi:hypothetical protein